MKNEKPNNSGRREILISTVPLILLITVIAVLTVVLLPKIRILSTPDGRADFKQYIDELRFGGWVLTLGIQLLQIFVAFIPGEPVELMLGYVWGPWLGTLTCLIGIFIGTSVIFLLVKRLGRRFVQRTVGERDMTKYKFLNDERKRDLAVFILFFIPGTPKDALSYIVPLTSIKPVKYVLIATLARIPSVVTSTVLGDRIAEGDYLASVTVFAVTALISVVGIILGHLYTKRKQESCKDDDS